MRLQWIDWVIILATAMCAGVLVVIRSRFGRRDGIGSNGDKRDECSSR